MSINFSYSRSNYWKVLIAFLLGCVAILLALGINKTTFRQMLSTVEQISKPDPKIRLVNNIFRDVVKLDQLQRQQALSTTARPYNSFIRESQHIQLMLDTLADISHTDTTQIVRIDSMKRILYERDNLFLNYLYLRTKFDKNDTLNGQIRSLSRIIAGSSLNVDSNMIRTEKRVTTTTIEHNDSSQNIDDRGFFDRLFGKKKAPRNPRQIEKLIREELKVNIDTSAIGKEDSVIKALDSAINYQEINRIRRRTVLLDRQMQLNREGNKLIGQLLSILHDIETEETANLDVKNKLASAIVDADIQRMDAILVLFIVCTAILMYFILTDISRSNRYRRQLIAAKEEAEQLGQVKQRFLANMSHELRTPLQAIIGVAEQARVENKGNDRLEVIYQSSLHLLQIVNEVLDYSRIVSGRFQLESAPFNMLRVLQEVAGTLQVQAEIKGLGFSTSFTGIDEGDYYLGDTFRLKQVLYNLLGNAIKFTQQGSVSLRVQPRQHDGQTTFTFSVQDTGMGIAAGDIDRIFNSFEQVGSTSSHKGTGLGLNIVREIVAVQNGTITVNSTPGAGSEFNVILTFPHTTAIADDVMLLPHDTVYTGKVWVVDDDTFILQLCAGILEKYKIPYLCFNAAEAALDAAWDNEVTLVMLDIRMPGMDGITLCREMKKKMGNAAASFVALTAQAMPDERDAILNSGFDALLMKPFMERDFIATISQYAHTQHQITNIPASLDIAAVIAMAGDDLELLNQTLESFVTETEKDIYQLQMAIAGKQYGAVADCLHRLASRSGQMGVRDLSLRMREIELHIRHQGTLPDGPGIFDPVFTALQQLINDVKLQIVK